MKTKHGTIWRFLSIGVLLSLMLIISSCRLGQRISGAGEQSQASPEVIAVSPGIPEVSGVILFQDDFQDGRADDWEINASWDVQQSGDLYRFTASGLGGAWVPRGSSWSDYLFHAGVRLDAGSLLLSMNMTQNGRYLLLLRSDGTYLMSEQPADNIIILAQTGPITTGTEHSVSMASQAGHLQVYVDRVLWMDYTDPAPITRGTIGVAALDGSRVAVDNVLVIQLSTPLPSGVAQAPPMVAGAPDPAEVVPEDGGGLPVVEVEPEPEPELQPGDQTGHPDIVIDNVSMIPNPPTQNQAMVVAVTVRNAGTADAGAFNVRWYPKGANFVGCSWDIFSLPAGESVDMVCDYQGYPNAGTFNWGANADADNEIAESNEDNNRQSGDMVVESAGLGEVPPAPTDCSSLSFASSSTEVIVGWNWPFENNLTEGFRIYQGTISLELEIPNPALRDERIDNLAPATQYHFDVRAFNAAGESPVDACSVDVTTNP